MMRGRQSLYYFIEIGGLVEEKEESKNPWIPKTNQGINLVAILVA